MQMEIYDARLLLEQLLGESRVQLQQQGFMVQLLLPQQELQLPAYVTSHSNTRSEPRLPPTPQLTAPDP